MTNETMQRALTSLKAYPTAMRSLLSDMLIALAERELARSQPKPVEAKEESTFEGDSGKWCECKDSTGYYFCTRQKGHTGEHRAHYDPSGQLVASWPNESPAPPKRDYGRERAEKMVTPLPDSETFSGGEVVRMHGMGMDFKARCPYASWMVDFLAGVASAARADGIEEAAKMLDEYTYSVLSDAVRKLK